MASRSSALWAEPGRRSIALVLAIALAAGAALQMASGLQPLQTAWHDQQARWFAPTGPVQGVLLVDIDEPSVRALRAQFGGWPPNRELLGLVSEYLLEVGARSVVVDLVLADPRDGDAALARVLAAHPGRLVLATSVLPAEAEPDAANVAIPPGPAGCPARQWAALLLPAESLMPAAATQPRLGMVSVAPDADGLLRGFPLWHSAPGRLLPSLPMAALLSAQGLDASAVRCENGAAQVGNLRLPIDSEDRIQPAWRLRADAVPLYAYATVARAALGAVDDAALREAVRDRTVFIGASAVLGDRVQTPVGPRWGPSLLAEAMGALQQGELVAPPSARFLPIWWLLALVPALVAWRRGHLQAVADAAWVAAALLTLLALDAGLYALRAQQSTPLSPAFTLLVFAVLSLVQVRRAMLETQHRLERERAAADAASRVKSEFLAHMSHEIRTPMNALLGSAELLAQTPLDERQSRYVALFQSAGASLMDILNDLLDLSKIEAGLLELHPQPFSLVELVARQTVLFEARASQKGLRLVTEFDPELPAVVLGDAPRLAQVLRNLLGNAIKFTHQGSVTLVVRRVQGTAHRLRFEVHDTGIGIALQEQQAIFQSFTQADSGVERAYGGTGLGLTISHRLVVMLMGGTIGVESRVNEGAVFHVEVELPQSRETPVVTWAPSSPDAIDDVKPALRLLLADDNPQNVLLVQAYLEGDGHSIDVVHDGAAAVERFRQGRYDVVLMDVQMPGMDGYRATAALRAIEQERHSAPVPVIALTANAMPDDERRSLLAGCTAHLSKPFSRLQLRNLLAQQFGSEPPPPHMPPDVAAFAAGPWPLPVLARLPGFDLASAFNRMGSETRLYLQVLQVAQGAMEDWPVRFAHAREAGDTVLMRRMAHDLKSTAATVGATALAQSAHRLETLLRSAAEAQTSAEDLPGLADAQAAVQPPLDELLAALRYTSP